MNLGKENCIKALMVQSPARMLQQTCPVQCIDAAYPLISKLTPTDFSIIHNEPLTIQKVDGSMRRKYDVPNVGATSVRLACNETIIGSNSQEIYVTPIFPCKEQYSKITRVEQHFPSLMSALGSVVPTSNYLKISALMSGSPDEHLKWDNDPVLNDKFKFFDTTELEEWELDEPPELVGISDEPFITRHSDLLTIILFIFLAINVAILDWFVFARIQPYIQLLNRIGPQIGLGVGAAQAIINDRNRDQGRNSQDRLRGQEMEAPRRRGRNVVEDIYGTAKDWVMTRMGRRPAPRNRRNRDNFGAVRISGSSDEEFNILGLDRPEEGAIVMRRRSRDRSRDRSSRRHSRTGPQELQEAPFQARSSRNSVSDSLEMHSAQTSTILTRALKDLGMNLKKSHLCPEDEPGWYINPSGEGLIFYNGRVHLFLEPTSHGDYVLLNIDEVGQLQTLREWRRREALLPRVEQGIRIPPPDPRTRVHATVPPLPTHYPTASNNFVPSNGYNVQQLVNHGHLRRIPANQPGPSRQPTLRTSTPPRNMETRPQLPLPTTARDVDLLGDVLNPGDMEEARARPALGDGATGGPSDDAQSPPRPPKNPVVKPPRESNVKQEAFSSDDETIEEAYQPPSEKKKSRR